MNILSAQNLAKSHGLKLLFSELTLGVDDRDRIGLIGANGCGKSTLLQILAGAQTADAGAVTMRQGLRVAYLPQNPVFEPGHSVIESVFSAADPAAAAVRDYEAACIRLEHDPHNEALMKQFDAASKRMDALSAWEYEFRAHTILGKLGVEDPDTRVDTLSGGYRKRVALAQTLLSEAQLLILDEPTNHLDADTVAWLEDYLRRFSGAVLLVTHDRYFLDRVTDRIAELDGGRLQMFDGNFAYYLERKGEMESAAMALDQRRRSILRKELEWLRRGARARTTKEKARIGRIAQLQQEPEFARAKSVSFEAGSRRLGRQIAELEGISKSYGERTLIRDFSYTFKPGERLGIIGPNGTGKTTLANILTGRTAPDAGTVAIGKTVVFGHFGQENTEFDLSERAIDYVRREGGDMLRGSDGSMTGAAQVMERFLFTSQMLYTPIEKLSGGERRRLALVRTIMRDPNFLVLDEPANDLDIPTLQALEDYLDGYSGCLVIVSHDRYLLDRTVEMLLGFESDGVLRLYPGNYSDYERLCAAERGTQAEAPDRPAPAQAREPRQENKPRKLSFNEQRELAALETGIPRMEQRLGELETEMVGAATDYQRLNALADEQKRLTEELERSVERWAELAERAGADK